jgi:uncharacterized protein YxeA
MMKYISQELRYGFNSKIYYVIIIFLSVLFGWILFLNYNMAIDSYNEYVKTENFYKESNEDINKSLKGDYKVENSGDESLVSNPLLYHKNIYRKAIYVASPKYILSQLMESSILLFPLIFGILGLIIATNDFKYGTIKLKTVRMDKITYSLVKQLSIVLSGLTVLAISILVAYIIGQVMYVKLSGIIPISKFPSIEIHTNSSMLTKFVLGFLIAVFFTEIGYALGVVFKNVIVGAITIVVYSFILPNLGVYDLKNSIFYFAKKVFDLQGAISIEDYKTTSFTNSILVILLIFFVSVALSIIITIKRSSFNT